MYIYLLFAYFIGSVISAYFLGVKNYKTVLSKRLSDFYVSPSKLYLQVS